MPVDLHALSLMPEYALLAELSETDGLSAEEVSVGQFLGNRLRDTKQSVLLSGLYYAGMQAVTSLGISTPPELEGLRSIMGWAETGVDAIDERLSVQGFRFPNSTAADDDLWEIWQANDMDAEHSLVHLDSLIAGTAYVVVGPSEEDGGAPVITTESALNMTAVYDTRTRRTACAYQAYYDVDPTSETYAKQKVALYLSDATIHLVLDDGWKVIDRDDHNMGVVPVVPFPNRQRVSTRHGMSEISAAWRNTIDRACRASNRLEIGSEYYITPKMIILGAAEKDFQNADGTTKSAWETYIGRVLALTGEGDGDQPTVQRFAAESPDGMIKTIDHLTHVMAGHTGLPPQYLGIFSDGNPASADAIRMSDFRLKTKADRKATAFGNCWEQVMRLALLIRDGELPDGAQAIETDWAPTGIPTPAADTDAVTKQIAAGQLAPTSDVALAREGYSAVERQRISNEMRGEQGRQVIQGILAATQQPPADQQPNDVPPVNEQKPPNRDEPNPVSGG